MKKMKIEETPKKLFETAGKSRNSYTVSGENMSARA